MWPQAWITFEIDEYYLREKGRGIKGRQVIRKIVLQINITP